MRCCLAFSVFCLLPACANDGEAGTPGGDPTDAGSTAADTLIEPTTAAASSSTGARGASSGVSSSGPGSSGAGSTSSTSTGAPPPEGPPVCTRDCELPSDCCRPDDPDCPSAVYPGNFGCVNGACVPPACRSDDECEGVFAGTTCETIFGHPQCVVACDGDGQCEGDDMACVGQTDDGQGYCRESCVDGGVLACPTTTCDEASGLCLCEPGDCPTGEICAPL